MTEHTSAVRDPLIDPIDALQLALDVAAVPHHPLDERLHGYQRQAVDHLYANPRAGLFLVPGLGKTAITLSALTSVHLPVLVVAPKNVAEKTWPTEIAKWRPDLSYSLVRGSAEKRQQRLKEDTDIHIISRDTFGGDLVGRKKPKYRTVIIDELSGFKNRGSARWGHMRRLVKDMPYVWGLTGTPSPNSLLDLWPQLFLLDRGARLGRTITAYRTKYFSPGGRLPNGVITNWLLRPGSADTIQHLVKDICMSVDKSVLNYPVQNDVYHYFDLPTKSRNAYDMMNRKFVAEVGETLVSVEHAAAKTNKLSQITGGFMYHSGLVEGDDTFMPEKDEITNHHRIRIDMLRDILTDAQGAPALVFYRFGEDRKRLLCLEGAVDIKMPNAIERWNRGEIPILIAHPAAAGHGLNLQTGGSLIVWYAMTWSSEEYVQGIGRLVRQGQPSPAVAVHHILARDTLDETMLDVAQGRISRQDALLEFLRRD